MKKMEILMDEQVKRTHMSYIEIYISRGGGTD